MTEPVGAPIPGSQLFRDYCVFCGDPIRVPQRRIGWNNQCDDCFRAGRRERGEVRSQQNVRGKSEITYRRQ